MATLPDRHDALFGALAAQENGALLGVEVIDVEAHGLGDSGTGAVEELKQRAIPFGERRPGLTRGREDGLDVGQRQCLGQPGGRSGRLHRGRRVGSHQPLTEQELVEPAHCHDRAGGAGSAEWRMLRIAGA